MEIKKYVSGDFRTNTYVVTINDKSIVIDPTLDLEEISKEIKEKYNVVGVLITHAHIDHIDGLIFFKEYPIYMSRIDYTHLNDGKYTLYAYYMLNIPFDPKSLDIHLLEDLDKIEILDETIDVMLAKGHTEGGLIYIFKESNVAFTGDTLFKGSIGRTDFLGGSLDDILKSVLKILDTLPQDMKLYPGHEGSTTVLEERRNNMYYISAKGKK